MDKPLCKCHGEPMHVNGARTAPEWRCAVRKREANREHHWHRGGREQRLERYAQRKRDGLCTRCGEPALTSSVCWDCLNEMEERYACRI